MQWISKKACYSAAACALLVLPGCNVEDRLRPQASGRTGGTEAVEKVNGVAITKTDLNRTVKALLTQSGARQPLSPETLKQASEAALNQLTAAELLYQAAAKLEIKDLDKQVTAKIVQSKYQYPSQVEFDKALKSVDMTQKDLEEAARKDIVINNFIAREIAPGTTVSEAEVESFYRENKEKAFTHGERITVSHILCAIPAKATAEQKQQAKQKALALLKRVKSGENFTMLAKTESESPSKEQGGDLGTVTRGQAVPEFEKAAFALKVGEVSDPVETRFGYHIIKVTGKQAPSTDRLQDVKAQIVAHLKGEKIRKALAACVEKLRNRAKIEKV